MRIIIDDLQLTDNKASQNNAHQSHHEMHQFLSLTSDIFRNKEHLEGRMECTLQIPRAPIRAAVDALVVEHHRQQANQEQPGINDFNAAQIASIIFRRQEEADTF